MIIVLLFPKQKTNTKNHNQTTETSKGPRSDAHHISVTFPLCVVSSFFTYCRYKIEQTMNGQVRGDIMKSYTTQLIN